MRAEAFVCVRLLTRIRAPTPLAGWRFVGAGQHPRPGYAPGRAVTFLLRKRKVTKRKAPPLPAPSAALREPAVRASGGVWLNSLRPNNASPFPPEAVLLGASRGGPGERDRPGCAGHRAGREFRRRLACGRTVQLFQIFRPFFRCKIGTLSSLYLRRQLLFFTLKREAICIHPLAGWWATEPFAPKPCNPPGTRLACQ